MQGSLAKKWWVFMGECSNVEDEMIVRISTRAPRPRASALNGQVNESSESGLRWLRSPPWAQPDQLRTSMFDLVLMCAWTVSGFFTVTHHDHQQGWRRVDDDNVEFGPATG